jgi:hypothetical protein
MQQLAFRYTVFINPKGLGAKSESSSIYTTQSSAWEIIRTPVDLRIPWEAEEVYQKALHMPAPTSLVDSLA